MPETPEIDETETAQTAPRWLEYVRVDQLPPAIHNPKGHDLDALDGSFDEFGFVDPIEVDERTGRIVAGHGRREGLIAREQRARENGDPPPEGLLVDPSGAWMVPVVRGWSSRDDDHALAYLIGNNRQGELGGWKVDELVTSLDELAASGRLAGTGYTLPDLDLLRAELEASRPRELAGDPDDVADPPREPITQPGDVWLLGDHRIVCGDSSDPDVLALALNGRPADQVFTSPPYNVGVDYDDYDDSLPWDEYLALLDRVMRNVIAHVAPGRAVCWVIGASPRLRPHRQLVMLEDLGLEFDRTIIWRKVGCATPTAHHMTHVRRFTPNYTHELVMVLSTGTLEPGPPAVGLDHLLTNDVAQVNQMAADGVPIDRSAPHGGAGHYARKAHPAAFPVALPALFIPHLAGPGEVVLDPFAGAASTLIACHQTGRVAACVELSPGYVDVAVERFERLTGLTPQRVPAGERMSLAGHEDSDTVATSSR